MTATNQILTHFETADPLLFNQLKRMYITPFTPITDSRVYFQKLCRAIIGQQLAGKAADAITNRFESVIGVEITPTAVLAKSEQELRTLGLSWAKVRYVRDLAHKVQSEQVDLHNLAAFSDEAVITELTKVTGIGRWTAEMFLIFTLGREDVFSFGDLGLKKGFLRLYETSAPEVMASVTQRWSPYRSYGSLALWHVLDSDVT